MDAFEVQARGTKSGYLLDATRPCQGRAQSSPVVHGKACRCCMKARHGIWLTPELPKLAVPSRLCTSGRSFGALRCVVFVAVLSRPCPHSAILRRLPNSEFLVDFSDGSFVSHAVVVHREPFRAVYNQHNYQAVNLLQSRHGHNTTQHDTHIGGRQRHRAHRLDSARFIPHLRPVAKSATQRVGVGHAPEEPQKVSGRMPRVQAAPCQGQYNST
jgi:hypothetical protein